MLWSVWEIVGPDVLKHLGFLSCSFGDEYEEAIKKYNCTNIEVTPTTQRNLERTVW